MIREVCTLLAALSEIVGNQAFSPHVLEPTSYEFQSVECTCARVLATTKREIVREVTVLSDSSGTPTWRIKHEK
jgi:hypothetical protein